MKELMPYECLHKPIISAFLSQANRQLGAVIIEVSTVQTLSW